MSNFSQPVGQFVPGQAGAALVNEPLRRLSDQQELMRKASTYGVLMTDASGNLAVKSRAIVPEFNCRYLELGGVIFFPESPFTFSPEDMQFMLSQKQAGSGHYKNIAYKPKLNKVTGMKTAAAEDQERMRVILADYARQVTNLMRTFLQPYANNWEQDYASFRPIEERGRKMRLRARNDLLHVDNFPTRPIYGDRIMRVFTNINPEVPRIWRTSDTFDKLAQKYLGQVPPLTEAPSGRREKEPMFVQFARKLGLKAQGSSPYDKWMLNFHNFLKENEDFQNNCRSDIWELPAGSAWIVMTDVVSHSVLSGQYALEQTYLVSQKDMVVPEMAPVNILRRLYGFA